MAAAVEDWAFQGVDMTFFDSIMKGANPSEIAVNGGGGEDGSHPRWEGRAPHLLETSRPGVFAVGDVRAGSVKRVASSVGEGSVVVSSVHQVLADP